MQNLKFQNRIGSGVILKCLGCKSSYGLFTDRWGLGRDFLLEDFELSFSVHQAACLLGKIFEVKINQKVGCYEKKD